MKRSEVWPPQRPSDWDLDRLGSPSAGGDVHREGAKDKYLAMDAAERRSDTRKPTFAAHVLMFRLGPEGGMSLKRVEVEEEDG